MIDYFKAKLGRHVRAGVSMMNPFAKGYVTPVVSDRSTVPCDIGEGSTLAIVGQQTSVPTGRNGDSIDIDDDPLKRRLRSSNARAVRRRSRPLWTLSFGR